MSNSGETNVHYFAVSKCGKSARKSIYKYLKYLCTNTKVSFLSVNMTSYHQLENILGLIGRSSV